MAIGSLAWVVVWFWYFRDVPADHPDSTPADLVKLPNNGQGIPGRRADVPWKRLIKRMAPVTLVYFCYGWTLWMYLNWLPQYFMNEYNLQLSRSALFSAAVFLAGVAGDYLGGEISDRILHKTGSLRKARRDFVIVAFSCSFLFMLPVFATHNLTLIVLSLAAAFFCAELVIGPMWSIPMDIAPQVFGDGQRSDEHGIGHRSRPLAGHIRLHRRLDRELAAAVHRVPGAPAPRRGNGVHDAPRTRFRRRTPAPRRDDLTVVVWTFRSATPGRPEGLRYYCRY